MVRNHEGSGNAPMIVCDYTAARHSFTGRPAIEPTKTNREKSCQRHQAQASIWMPLACSGIPVRREDIGRLHRGPRNIASRGLERGDCFVVPKDGVSTSGTGYILRSYGEVVPYNEAQPSLGGASLRLRRIRES
jgi:hypothetical protein